MSHTPGPWTIESNSENLLNIYRRDESSGIDLATLIAVVGIDDAYNHDEERANAHLISAAPDLFKALLAVKRRLADLDTLIAYTKRNEGTHRANNKVLEQAEKALTKAEGGA